MGTSEQQANPLSATASAQKKTPSTLMRRLTIVFLGISLLICAWILTALYTEVLQGPRGLAYMVLLLPAATAFYCTLAIVQWFASGKWLRTGIGVVKWIGTLAFPVVLVITVESMVPQRMTHILQSELAPIIEHIEKSRLRTGIAPESLNGRLPYNSRMQITNLAYAAKAGRYLLKIKVPSIDLDGAVMFYDPDAKTWLLFHNDSYARYQELAGQDNPGLTPGTFINIRRYLEIEAAAGTVTSYRRSRKTPHWEKRQ